MEAEMTTIHNIGIVIQQGSAVAEAQQIKHHQTNPSNIAASHQPAKDIKEQSTVQESGNAEKSDLKDKEEGNRGNQQRLQGQREGEKPENEGKRPDSTGYIIDTMV